MPRADSVPAMAVLTLEVPCRNNPLGRQCRLLAISGPIHSFASPATTRRASSAVPSLSFATPRSHPIYTSDDLYGRGLSVPKLREFALLKEG